MSAIHWLNDIIGDFGHAANWSGGSAPGPSDDAILDASGVHFTVIAGASETIDSIQLAANATLDIAVLDVAGGTFTATAGTGSGANAGHIVVANQATLAIGGAFDNSGAIRLVGRSGVTSLQFTADTTLSGGGAVTLTQMSTRADLYIEAAAGAGTVTLTNIDDTISGEGNIGSGGAGADSLVLVNGAKGVIEAVEYNLPLVFGNSDITSVIANSGLIEADAGTAHLYNATVTGTGGRLLARTGSQMLLSDCVVSGQTLEAQAGSYFILDGGGSATLQGRLENAGAMFLISESFIIARPVTLTGGGSLQLGYGTTGYGPVVITGAKAATVFTNVDNTINGFGSLGDGKLTLINEAGGTIDANGLLALTIDTGKSTIANAGLIETSVSVYGPGAGLLIKSAIANTGTIAVNTGILTVDGAVSGPGQVLVGGGTLYFKSGFSETVTFTGATATATLELALSQTYAGAVAGFSLGGGTSLDLGDIGFVSASEASFSGTSSSGVLTVTDGVHTSHIHLVGDYLGATFAASRDGHGGTTVVAGAGGVDAPLRAFIAAMASLEASPAQAVHASEPLSVREPRLMAPRVAIA